jgi:adenine/guanine phosphoribosyltransferase-like PRPP-binding protein
MVVIASTALGVADASTSRWGSPRGVVTFVGDSNEIFTAQYSAADLLNRMNGYAIVNIARGGLVPATMAAGIMALPLAIIGFERATGATQWIGAPASGARVLLVDDGCSTGRTMEAVRGALLHEGRDCLTLAVVHDPEVTRYVPDLSHAMRALWRFPWERGEATPAGRALRATGAGPDRATELPVALIEQAR